MTTRRKADEDAIEESAQDKPEPQESGDQAAADQPAETDEGEPAQEKVDESADESADVSPQGLVHGPEGDDVQPLVEGAPVSAAARHNVRYGTA